MINLPNGFYAKINESGTHIHKGFLKVRVDIYSPVGSKTHSIHWVDHFDREPTEEELADEALLALIPRHKELNPCLCHFIIVNPEITKEQLVKKVQEIFTVGTLVQLDDSLSNSNITLVQQNMRFKGGSGRKLGKDDNATILMNQINTLLRET